MTSTLVWYTARASGIVAWALLAAGVVWGLMLSSRVVQRQARPAWLLDLHRFLAATALVFLVVHVTSILLDTYVHFGLVEVLVPLTGSWHPAAVSWGIAGMYLLVALEITSLLRSRLPRRAWRASHFLAFPAFVLATAHGLTAGTDRHSTALKVAFYGVSALVAVLAAVPAVGARRDARRSATSVAALSGARPTRALELRRAATATAGRR
jgi:predicted ferric reductase